VILSHAEHLSIRPNTLCLAFPKLIPSLRPETLANWSRDARLTGEEFTTHILIARRHGGRWQTMATTTQVYFIIALAELLNGIIYVWLY